MKKDDFAGMKVTVMGLGLNGGGLESARYLASRGAEVTATDLRDEKVLAPSIEKLKDLPIRYVLGEHRIEDFSSAGMVVKNPAVRPDSPFLKAAGRIETDISLFLAACPRGANILAVTGSKGKSSTASALYWALKESRATGKRGGKAHLGGNITVSPLSFLDEVEDGDDVVLELSSFQLGDLRGRDILKPRAAIITSIMRDHLDRYGSMEAYVADKRLIYANQGPGDLTVAADDDWGRSFLAESRGRPIFISEDPGRLMELVPEKPLVPGRHQKKNLLAAGLVLSDLGLDAGFVRESLGSYPGIEHRLEFFHEARGIRFYNDSAATIPEAAAAAVDALSEAFERPPVLLSGGTDKVLDFSPLVRAASRAKAVVLLAGTGSEKIKNLLDQAGIAYNGPFDSLEAAISATLEAAAAGDSVVLSPGCASFGMFLNEFDRGKKWKEGVKQVTGNSEK
ncbi:MAG: UDP-N-acetylmuramoyl-L-alanine--D-glutamate ligase [Treponema sp.]|nr:UDP-N-acetylmuramoyl-L-alanine--D-glutamate ligase [Treponema sp.]